MSSFASGDVNIDDEEYEYDDYDYDDDDDDVSKDGDDNDTAAVITTNTKVSGKSSSGSNSGNNYSSNTNKHGNNNNYDKDDYTGIRLVPALELFVEMDTMICETSEILAIPKDVAGILLRTYDWSSEKLCEAYYSSSNKEELWKHSGIYHRCCKIRDDDNHNDFTNNNINNDNTATTKYSHKKRSRPTSSSSNNDEKLCPICYETMGGNNSNNNNNTNKDSTVVGVVGVDADVGAVASMAMGCGHEFCTECWTDFCSNAILNEGPGCITTTCPDATCTEAVTEKEMQAFLSPEHFEKFRLYVLSSFVEANPMTRWCPAPGCGQIACATSRQALERAKGIATCTNCGSGSSKSTTSSSSSCSFCMLCGEEPHAPCDCTTLAQWTDKNQSESETANWILVNTKSCPKCKVRIEKNSGCNHMTCHKCRHNFCWICLGSYEGYGSHRCNKFESAKDESKAKLELERYLHYFTRYQAHKKSEEYAKKQLQTTEEMMIRSDNHTTMDIRFMKDVHEQLIDCRRVLKYSYAYGYFHMMHPPNTNNNNTSTVHKIPFQKERFEQHQAVLEQFTENLSGLSEKPMEDLLEKLRADAINQCRVVKKYIDNVLLHVEGGMDEDEF